MKFIKYSWLAALPMIFTACQDDMLVEKHQGLEGMFVLKASVDEEGSFSRAQIKLEEQEDGRKYGAFQWDEEDEFKMYEFGRDEDDNLNLVATHAFAISGYSNASPSSSANFVSSTVPTDGNQFYAYYPSLEADTENGTMKVSIDQNLADNSADSWKAYFNRNMFMYAEGQIRGTETELRFAHQCGLINVSYTNETSETKLVKGISLNGDWGVSKTFRLHRPWSSTAGTNDSDGYGISFTEPVSVAAGATEDFFILFMEPYNTGNTASKKMTQLSMVYSVEENTTSLTTDSYTIGMPDFNRGGGYRLNVKHTTEDKLEWAKAPVVEGFKVGTPDELVAALNSQQGKIALSADIALESPLSINYEVSLDLAGFTISMDQSKHDTFTSGEDALIVVHRGGDLTINDASNGKGVINPGINYPTSTIKMVGNSDEGESLAKLTINEGQLAGYNVISGSKGKGNTEIIINGGDINGGWDVDHTNGKGATGIFHPQAGTLTINGGSVWGCQSVIEMRAGTLVINDGEIGYNKDWRTFTQPTTANGTDGTTMRGCVAIGISQGEDNLPLSVTVHENANINARGEDVYAIYEVDLHDNNTDNVTISIEGSEHRVLGISGLIYSENKKEFIGSYTHFNNPSALSYLAKGAKPVAINCYDWNGDFFGQAACIPDSDVNDGADVYVNLSGKTWTIQSGDSNYNYFYVGKNNNLTLANGTICVPENATGKALIKANNAILNLVNITINSSNIHHAIDIEDGKLLARMTNINAGENCYAFNILASSLERDEPMFDLVENCVIDGNFKLDVTELPETANQSYPPILFMGNVDIDGDLFVSENITNDWLYYCVYRTNEVEIANGCTGWDSVQNATDENLPTLPVYITDLNWIDVIEANYEGENTFVKSSEGYVAVDNLTNQSIIESITRIVFDSESDYSAIEKLQYIEKFKSLETLELRNTSVSALDLSNNTALTDVEVDNNKLDTLIVAGCNQLESLKCTDDYLAKLDLSECGQSLTFVSLNLPSLTDFDISNCQILNRLQIDKSNLSSLSLPETTGVKYLELEGTSIKSLDVNQCLGLEYLYCYLPFGLTSLDLSNCDELKEVNFSSNGGGDYKYEISSFNVTGCDQLTKFTFSQYNDTDIKATFTNCPSLSVVTVPNCKSLELTGCTSLKTLSCPEGSLTSLDLSSCPNLEVLGCANNQLTELVFAENNVMSKLSCNHNAFTELDVTALSGLTILNCQYNALEKLNVSGLNDLEELNCSTNKLSSLSVKELSSLKSLDCSFNQLTSLDVSNMAALEELSYRGNASDLDVLNLSGLSFITELNLMHYNTHYDESVTYKIKELNVSNCSNLTEITFYEGIGLEILDISSRDSGQLPDSPNLITFKNASYVKGLKKIKLDQWHFDWYDDTYGIWGSFTSGEQDTDTYLSPNYYKGYPYPVFEYPNGYTNTSQE